MQKKSILITGCSSGIGLCAAKILREKDYRVFASARKKTDVDQLKTLGFEAIQLDVDEPASIDRATSELFDLTGGTLDALFNNAGYVQFGAVEDLSRESIRKQFETNVFGPIELTQRVLPIMRKQGHGRIIQNSSILGVTTIPFYGAYNASKFALEAFSKTLRQELQGTNIYISLINPGPVKTNITENTYQHYKDSTEQQQESPFREKYKLLEKAYFNEKKSDKFAAEPEAVVKKLIHALESSKPKLHYFVGVPANFIMTLKHALPEKTLDWLLGKSL